MFENPDFEVDREAEEYRLLNPVLSRLDKSKPKAHKVEVEQMEVRPLFQARFSTIRNRSVFQNEVKLYAAA